ncbi:MAG: hypothetical protein E7Z90_05640 [Cyanobacteria bacterium SIG29]|nr:hypothetical protein [Cyanobacteria bacterium SIG29]
MTVSFQNGSFMGGSATAGTYTVNGGVTASSLYNSEFLDKKYDYTDTRESYEIAYSGRDAAIESKISNIGSYLANGKEDKAMDAYNELLAEMGNQTRYAQLVGEDGDDTQLRAIARQLIEMEIGGNLEDFIRDNAKTQAGVEHQKILTWGNCDSTSQEDLLAEMCDIKEEEGHGNIIVGALAGIASPFVALGNWLFNGGKKM